MKAIGAKRGIDISLSHSLLVGWYHRVACKQRLVDAVEDAARGGRRGYIC